MAILLEELYKTLGEDTGRKIFKEKKKVIGKRLSVLISLRNELQNLHAIQKIENHRKITSGRLAKILNFNQDNNFSYWRTLMDDKSILVTKNVLSKLFKAYNIIEEISAEIGFVNIAPKLTFYYQSQTGMKRIEDLQAVIKNLDDFLVGEVRSQGLRIKFNETALRDALNELEAREQEIGQDVTQHYNDFFAIFGAKKINKGVATEAFERHWRLAKHLQNPATESFKAREVWKLYDASKGNAPFYSGGDVEDSQVKMLNASIISNTNTILNAMSALIQLLTKVENQDNTEEIIEQYKKSFGLQETGIFAEIKKNAVQDIDSMAKKNFV